MRKFFCLVCVIVAGLVLSASAQQEVNRYDLFTGYSHLSSPSVNLGQNGFDTTFGANLNRWLAVGADFSWFDGNGAIPVDKTKVYNQLVPFLGGTKPSVPFDAQTYTFAAGPQINIRHFEKVMFFVRPGLGVIHERATPHLSPQLQALLASGLVNIPQLKPKMNDTVVFYGFGGGFDVNASKHVGLRFSVDFVRTPLFSDLLESRNAVRISVGPTWKWGTLK